MELSQLLKKQLQGHQSTAYQQTNCGAEAEQHTGLVEDGRMIHIVIKKSGLCRRHMSQLRGVEHKPPRSKRAAGQQQANRCHPPQTGTWPPCHALSPLWSTALAKSAPSFHTPNCIAGDSIAAVVLVKVAFPPKSILRVLMLPPRCPFIRFPGLLLSLSYKPLPAHRLC